MLKDQAKHQEQRVLSSPSAAKWVGLSEQKMRDMRRDGTGPDFVILSSNRLGYLPADLDAWLAARPKVKTVAEADKARAVIDKARKAAFRETAAV